MKRVHVDGELLNYQLIRGIILSTTERFHLPNLDAIAKLSENTRLENLLRPGAETFELLPTVNVHDKQEARLQTVP